MSTREEVQALGFKVPDAIEPIVAYRSWKVGPGQKTLLSINGTVWVPGRSMKAQCPYCRHSAFTTGYVSRRRHPVDETPHKHCTCGIYAAKREDARVLVPQAPVYGEVYLWGKIQEGHRGYRAQFAYPKRLFVLTGRDKVIVEKMGFGVPVLVVRGQPYGLFPFPGSRRWITNPLTAFSAVMRDMSKVINQVLVGVLYGTGAALIALQMYLPRLLP